MSKKLDDFRGRYPALAETPELLAIQITQLERALKDLGVVLAHQAANACFALVEDAGAGGESLDAAVTTYASLYLKEGDDANDTMARPGLLGVDRSLLDYVETVNEQKQALKTLCKTLDTHRVFIHSPEHGKRERLVRHLLGILGKDSFSRLSAYREVRVLDRKLDHVSFSRCFNRRVYCVSREEVLSRLRESHPDAEGDRKVMEDRKPGESFALALGYSTTIRANIRYPRHWESIKRRMTKSKLSAEKQGLQQLVCPMPLIVPTDKNPVMPGVSMPKRKVSDMPDTNVQARKGHLKAEPLIKSMPVFEYQDGYQPIPMRAKPERQRAAG